MTTAVAPSSTLSARDLLFALTDPTGLPAETLLVQFPQWGTAVAMLGEHGFETHVVHRYRVMVRHDRGFWIPVAVYLPPRAHLSTAAASALAAVDSEVAHFSNGAITLEDLNSRRLSDSGVLAAVRSMLDRHAVQLPDSLENWSNLLMYPALLVAEALSVLMRQHLCTGKPGTCPEPESQEQEVLSVLLCDSDCLPAVLPGLAPPDPFDSVAVWRMLAHVCDNRLLSVARAV